MTKSDDDTVAVMLQRFQTGQEIRQQRRDGDRPDGMEDGSVTVTNEVPSLRGSIEVCHVQSKFDIYGGRGGSKPELRHLNNTEPIENGWLGNPHQMTEDTTEERRRVIAAFLHDFLDRIEADDDFRDAIEGLRGQRVACWCRGVCADRTPDNWCHLDVVHHWLDGDLTPVYGYLRGTDL